MIDSFAQQMPDWIAYALTAWVLLATPRACLWLFTRPLPCPGGGPPYQYSPAARARACPIRQESASSRPGPSGHMDGQARGLWISRKKQRKKIAPVYHRVNGEYPLPRD